jgi:plastocyanin
MALLSPVAPLAEAPPVEEPAVSVPDDVVAPAAAPSTQPAPATPSPSPPAAPSAAPPPREEQPATDPVDPPAEDAPRKAAPPVDAVAKAAASGAVTIEDFSFTPATITIDVGDSVTWRNDGPSSHTATAADGSFDTGLLGSGESRTISFDEAGSFSYLCQPHPFMKGTVKVVAQSSGSGTGGTAGAGAGSGASIDGAAAAADGAALPSTGSSPLWLAVTGLGLLAIGRWGTLQTGRGVRG